MSETKFSNLFFKKFVKFLAFTLIGAGLGAYIAHFDSLSGDKLSWVLFSIGGVLLAALAYIEKESPNPKKFFSGRILRILGAIIFGVVVGYVFGKGLEVNLLTYLILVGSGYILWGLSRSVTARAESKKCKIRKPSKRTKPDRQ